MLIGVDCVFDVLLSCLCLLHPFCLVASSSLTHVPLAQRFGLPPLALYDPCRRSGVWNLCSGEGGPCLMHSTGWRASSVIFGDQCEALIPTYSNIFQHHSNTNFLLLAEGLPGSSVKQQPAPPSQETVLIVREQTQDQAGMTDAVPWTPYQVGTNCNKMTCISSPTRYMMISSILYSLYTSSFHVTGEGRIWCWSQRRSWDFAPASIPELHSISTWAHGVIMTCHAQAWGCDSISPQQSTSTENQIGWWGPL